jgi:4-hydroxythreonine-4-phosphate dehydrogenase
MATLALSVGCPSGIGPEVSVVAAAELSARHPEHRVVLFGDRGALEAAASVRRVDLAAFAGVSIVAVSELVEAHRRPGRPAPLGGASQLAAIDQALDAVLTGRADALVTGPVSKHTISSTGVRFLGHTEYLAERTGTRSVVMSFIGPGLRTALVTTHLPLRDVPTAITPTAVATTLGITARALWRDFALESPRIAVCGLNPHAGEGGLLGDEEVRAIAPGIESARLMLDGLATIVGPLPAEAAFRLAKEDRAFDAVVAMFHDQATIASKMVDFGDAVNVTLGLPIVRTSVDHGTGYDIAYTGRADARGMLSALRMALEITQTRALRGTGGAAR